MTYHYQGRREDGRLLTGSGRYTADWTLPGQLHAAFLRSDHAHAAVRGIDVSAALAAPGVAAVLTGADMVAAGYDRGQALMPFKGRGEALRQPPARPWRWTACASSGSRWRWSWPPPPRRRRTRPS